MPANEWNIRIISTPGTAAAQFVPQVPTAAIPPGTPANQLLAQVGDVVTWGNATDETHWPWPATLNNGTVQPVLPLPNVVPPPSPPAPPATLPNGYMSDAIPAQNSSAPSFVIPSVVQGVTLAAKSVIYYCCSVSIQKNPPVLESGSIQIF